MSTFLIQINTEVKKENHVKMDMSVSCGLWASKLILLHAACKNCI